MTEVEDSEWVNKDRELFVLRGLARRRDAR